MKKTGLLPALLIILFLSQARIALSKNPDSKEPGRDSKTDPINSVLSTGSRYLPVFISVRLARQMTPETVAAISGTIPVDRAVAISKGLDRDFLAEVTCHLDPVKGAPIIERLPEELSVDVVKRLIKKGEAKVAGRLADHLSSSKLIALSKGLTVSESTRIGFTMTRKKLIVSVLSANSDTYLVDLLSECITLDYYQLIADVVQEMDAARNVRVLSGLHMDKDAKTRFLGRLSRHLSPEKSAEIIEQCPEPIIADVVAQLIREGNVKITGAFSDHLSRRKLYSVSGSLSNRQKVQVAYCMKKRALIAGVLGQYPDDHVVELLNETLGLGYYDLIADMVETMKPGRVKNILSGFSDADFIKMMTNYDPDKFAKIIKTMDAALIKDFSKSMKNEKIAIIVDHAPPSVINTLWPYFSEKKKLEVLPLVDLDKLPRLWNGLDKSVRLSLIDLSRQYKPLSSTIKRMPPP